MEWRIWEEKQEIPCLIQWNNSWNIVTIMGIEQFSSSVCLKLISLHKSLGLGDISSVSLFSDYR